MRAMTSQGPSSAASRCDKRHTASAAIMNRNHWFVFIEVSLAPDVIDDVDREQNRSCAVVVAAIANPGCVTCDQLDDIGAAATTRQLPWIGRHAGVVGIRRSAAIEGCDDVP